MHQPVEAPYQQVPDQQLRITACTMAIQLVSASGAGADSGIQYARQFYSLMSGQDPLLDLSKVNPHNVVELRPGTIIPVDEIQFKHRVKDD